MFLKALLHSEKENFPERIISTTVTQFGFGKSLTYPSISLFYLSVPIHALLYKSRALLRIGGVGTEVNLKGHTHPSPDLETSNPSNREKEIERKKKSITLFELSKLSGRSV